jgi:diacylglycerol kinase family enzyme
MVVFVNRHAAAGAGLKKWEIVWEVVRSRLGHPRVCIMDDQETTRRSIEREIFSGETRFIAAGGDGTVNFIANTLAAVASAAQRDLLSLGAVGTGSSNDFHKPLRREALHRGIPLAIDFDNTISRDIGCVTYDDQGAIRRKYFLVNASIGVTANANGFFNAPDRTLSAIKRCSTGGAILYAALHTIVGHRNIPVTISSGERTFQNVDLSNLGITKNPWFSGSLCYGGVPHYTDGLFSVFLCHSMSAGDLVQLLGGLQRGVFPQTDGKTEAWKSNSVTVSSAVPFSVECDGEVVHTRRARFDVIPQSLKVCR